MAPERKWQLIAGVCFSLFVLAAVVAVRQFHQNQLLRSTAPSRTEIQGDPAPAIAPATSPAIAATDPQSEDTIAREVALRIRKYHQDLTAKRNGELATVVKAQSEFLMSAETQKRAFEAFRGNLKVRYSPLYAALGFSAPEIAAFENAMMDRFWMVSDATVAAHLAKIDGSGALELKSEELKALDTKVQTLLGNDRFRALRDFDASADARAVGEALAGKIASSHAPLSPAQVEQVVALVVSTEPVVAKKDDWLQAAVIGRLRAVSFGDVDWSRIRQEQLGFLSPAQRTFMSAFLTDAQQRQAIRDDFKQVERDTRATFPRETSGK